MLMKKFTLFLISMFCMLGTSMAQENALELQEVIPGNGKSVLNVNYVQLTFNKDVEMTLPEGGITVNNNTTGESYKLSRLNDSQYLPKNLVVLMFEQKSVTGKDGKEELVDLYPQAPGEYSYTIPAGCIRSTDGEEFAEHTFTFKIAAPLAIESVTPDIENGTTKLEKIEITFNSAISKVDMPTSGLTVVDMSWTPVANIKNEVTFSDDRKTVTLELETPITTIGTYNLDIHPGVFTSEDGNTNEYVSLGFSVIDPTPSFSTNLKEGEKVKELGNLEITFKNVNEVKLVEGAEAVVVYMPGDGETTGTATLANNKITVTFDQEFTEEGYYTFVIPAGMFTMDGVENEEYTVMVELYTFVITPLKVVNVTPVEGAVNQISKIVVEFNQTIYPSYDENWQMISREITLKGDKQDYTLTYAPSSYDVTNKMEYLVNAVWNGYDAYESTPVTEAGTYTLDLASIVVDYAGESYIDEWGYPNTRWHGKNGKCEGTCTWTISGSDTPDTPAPGIDLTKAYRVKDVTNNKYLHVGNYDVHEGGATGGVKVEVKEENGDQIFTIEDAGNGQYYLKSLEGHYIVCRAWNVDGSKDAKSALGFEFIDETQFYITNAKGYFKVENIEGVDYPFCDSGLDKAATWVLEEAAIPAGIEDITAGDVENTIYDITGRRIESITKAGIYVVNGKKVLVK